MARPPSDSAQRQARLAAALRENLRKRKAQARARDEAAQAEQAKPAAETGQPPEDKGGA
jgi:hypothetical protein